jgi:hypothetical protein
MNYLKSIKTCSDTQSMTTVYPKPARFCGINASPREPDKPTNLFMMPPRVAENVYCAPLKGSAPSEPILSIIVPITDNDVDWVSTYKVILDQFEPSDERWEVVFINHGSSEWAWIHLQRLMREDPIHVRSLMVMSGQDRAEALALGYREARGEVVITMEMDEFDDPREISVFLKRIEWTTPRLRALDGAGSNRWQGILPRGVLRGARGRAVVA